jgi:hypothetical protein
VAFPSWNAGSFQSLDDPIEPNLKDDAQFFIDEDDKILLILNLSMNC